MSSLLVLLCLGAADRARAQGEVLGYWESRFYGFAGQGAGLAQLETLGGFDFAALGVDPTAHWAFINRLRPTAKLHLDENSSVVATVLGETRHGFFTERRERVEDIASLERLYVSHARGSVDLLAGKQLIAWGSGLLLSPTDVLNRKPVNDLAAERPGVWGARVSWALSPVSNLHVAAAVDEEKCCDAVVLGRYDVTVGLTDLAGTVAWQERADALLVGFDVKGEHEVGYWAEGAWVVDLGRRVDAGHLLLELGVDYSFPVLEQLYLALEWIHQGDGVGGAWVGANGRTPDYLGVSVLGDDPSESRLLGTNYALLLARLVVDSDWSTQLLSLLNLRDPSGTSVLQLTWAATGWLELTLGGQASYGRPGSEFNLRTPDSALLPAGARNVRIQPALAGWLWGRAYF